MQSSLERTLPYYKLKVIFKSPSKFVNHFHFKDMLHKKLSNINLNEFTVWFQDSNNSNLLIKESLLTLVIKPFWMKRLNLSHRVIWVDRILLFYNVLNVFFFIKICVTATSMPCWEKLILLLLVSLFYYYYYFYYYYFSKTTDITFILS